MLRHSFFSVGRPPERSVGACQAVVGRAEFRKQADGSLEDADRLFMPAFRHGDPAEPDQSGGLGRGNRHQLVEQFPALP